MESKVAISNPIPSLSKSDISRFWSKVDITANPDKCWNWTASKRRRGYGRFCIQIGPNKDISFVATRVAYFIENGECPIDKIVLHSCDNPSCVNPKHLSLGTNKDNTKDMMLKNRGTEQFKTGSNHPKSKLSEADILAIKARRAKGETQKSIALSYGIDQSLISRVTNNKLWKHLK